jgi:hypothetical protein
MFRDPDDANDRLLSLAEANGDVASAENGEAPRVRAPEAGFKTWLGMTEDKEIWEIASLLTTKYGRRGVALAQARARRLALADDLSAFVIWHAVMEAAEELLRPQRRPDEWAV